MKMALEKYSIKFDALLGFRRFAPPIRRVGIPPVEIGSQKVHEKTSGKRGQGDVPLGLPPPLGERGGHSHKRWELLTNFWRK